MDLVCSWPTCKATSPPGVSLSPPGHLSPEKALEVDHVPLPFHRGTCEPERLVSRMLAAQECWLRFLGQPGPLLARRQLWEQCACGHHLGDKLIWLKRSFALASLSWNVPSLVIRCTVEYSGIFECGLCIICVTVPPPFPPLSPYNQDMTVCCHWILETSTFELDCLLLWTTNV